MRQLAVHLPRSFPSLRVLQCSEPERKALDQYPWPMALRIAGYITAVSAVGSMLVTIGWDHPSSLIVASVLGLLFLVSFHKLTEPQRWTTRNQRLLLLLVQVAVCAILPAMTFNFGADILVYMLAAEIQFLFSFRIAIAGTVLLWAGLSILVVITDPAFLKGHVEEYIVASPAGFAFVAAFTRSAVTEMVQRFRTTELLDELNIAHSQLQAYANQVEELTVTRERNRMAREIHDTLGHYLTVINIQIETAQKLHDRDPSHSREALTTAKQLATECLNEVRRSVSALRPAALDNIPLPEALAHLIDSLQQSTGLTFHIETHGEGVLRPEVEETAYRVIQEALTNVRKHSRAHNVWLRLEWDHEAFSASVCDDGRGTSGASVDDQPESFGLRSMRERLARVEGTLDIDTAPGAGFSIAFRIPHPIATSPPQTALEEEVVRS